MKRFRHYKNLSISNQFYNNIRYYTKKDIARKILNKIKNSKNAELKINKERELINEILEVL